MAARQLTGALAGLMAYAAMWVVQNRGAALIGLIHGPEAQRAVETADVSDVAHNRSYTELCQAYEAHHYNSMSNCLHAAGYVLSFLLLWRTLVGTKSTSARLLRLVWLPPLWYLFAWAGHLLIQSDVPAVFSYGMSWRGWAAGEWCALTGFLKGDLIYGVKEVAVTSTIVLSHVMVCGV